MKTRIISAAVMISIVVAVLSIGKIYSLPLLITFFVALICAAGIYELLHNVAGIKPLGLSIGGAVYGFITVFLLYFNSAGLNIENPITEKLPLFISIIYFVFAVIVVLYKHKDFTLDKILGYTAYPFVISYGFSFLNNIIIRDSGIYYLLLLINFASICDTGAYFVGSFFGKTKLCPEISPKKTVEGAVGGIVSSIIVSLILVFAFKSPNLVLTLVFTVPLCILGMLGDLFASAIKRSVGLKDYSNLIPGHGGILDRFDSMLLIAPVLYMLIEFGVV